MKTLIQRIEAGKRLTQKQALRLFNEAGIHQLSALATQRLARFHTPGNATFLIDRNINYTNICTTGCRFCSFFRNKNSPEAYQLTKSDILKKVSQAVAKGATQIMLQGGLNPGIGMDYFESVLKAIKATFPVALHSFSPPEIFHFSSVSGCSVKEALERLKAAGLDSLPGGGAEILSDRVRSVLSPKKIDSKTWLDIMKQAHDTGLKTTATMMIGSLETLQERITHLDLIRRLQDKTGGFRAFIPWTFVPGKSGIAPRSSGIDYLRTLALCRIYLDNIENIQGSWVTQGKDVGQMSLFFGANDLGSIMLEENVVRAAGAENRITELEMVHLIRKAGKIPLQRNTEYTMIKKYG